MKGPLYSVECDPAYWWSQSDETREEVAEWLAEHGVSIDDVCCVQDGCPVAAHVTLKDADGRPYLRPGTDLIAKAWVVLPATEVP